MITSSSGLWPLEATDVKGRGEESPAQGRCLALWFRGKERTFQLFLSTPHPPSTSQVQEGRALVRGPLVRTFSSPAERPLAGTKGPSPQAARPSQHEPQPGPQMRHGPTDTLLQPWGPGSFMVESALCGSRVRGSPITVGPARAPCDGSVL